ncbi:MAG: hypothetical protein A2Y10_18055 [Planctomycetes bacterium GWF2_41_51]|nr:MAG: hypothetical protein A2Y10_18055 [Planctomycetes bacterium GWF2_41_51]
MSDLNSNIETNAAAPAKVTSDGCSVEQHSLAEQIAADRYLKSQQATKSKGLGIKFTKFNASGSV